MLRTGSVGRSVCRRRCARSAGRCRVQRRACLESGASKDDVFPAAVRCFAGFAVVWTLFGYELPSLAVHTASFSAPQLGVLQLTCECAKALATAVLLQREGVKFNFKLSPRLLFLAVGGGGVCVVFSALLTTSHGAPPHDTVALAHEIPVWLSALVVAPAVEEAFFRGFLLSTQSEWGTPLAVTVQAALFAAMHFGRSFDEMRVLFAVGLVLGCVSAASSKDAKNLGPPILSHAIFNACAWSSILVAGQL